jgi:asparagine synthase (glutamine-hydrolysing)
MCGIVGLYSCDSKLIREAPIRQAAELLRHRGPDNISTITFSHAALGHTRLSIVDLSTAANQPFQTEDGRYTIVFNGEIYNYKSIKRSLERTCNFRTCSDTEVLLQAYIQHGPACLPLLNGIFAFAIYDSNERTLFLARDRWGVKPLYVSYTNTTVTFASETKSILALNPGAKTICPQGFHEFLYYGTALGGRTLFEGIQQLRPGHYLLAKANGVKVEVETNKYWDINDIPASPSGNLTETVAQTARQLENAVVNQLTGDVPIGVFLSGGLDSSAITTFASRNLSTRLKTFSCSFDFSSSNELALARLVAERAGTEHHEVHITGGGLFDTVVQLVRAHDSPFSDAANIPLYLLCQQISGQIKVVLQGDGGDELFGGYRRYSTLRIRQLLKLIAQLSRSTGALNLLPHRLRRYLACFDHKELHRVMAWLLTLETESFSPASLLKSEIQEKLHGTNPLQRYEEVYSQLKPMDAVQAMLQTDMQVILPDVFLEKVDKSTMAHGVEVRVPLLDNELVDFVVGLPSSDKASFWTSKKLMRMALQDTLPGEVVKGKKKGFGVPYSDWLRGPLYDTFTDVLQQHQQDYGVLDVERITQLRLKHSQGDSQHEFLLWKIYNFAIWTNEYQLSF